MDRADRGIQHLDEVVTEEIGPCLAFATATVTRNGPSSTPLTRRLLIPCYRVGNIVEQSIASRTLGYDR